MLIYLAKTFMKRQFTFLLDLGTYAIFILLTFWLDVIETIIKWQEKSKDEIINW